MPRIGLFVPYFSGSHRRWAEGYARAGAHEVVLFTLPGRHWKWRMHGAAVTLARQFLADPRPFDALLATDMLDLATFLALTRERTARLPVTAYFHENQLTYPWSPTDQDTTLRRDRHYAWLNFTTALAADRVLFNSQYHHDSFLGALPAFLHAFPDHQEVGQVAHIAAKSAVCHLGMDLRALDTYRPPAREPGPPVLLWNHRWEYDKNPEGFFRLCERLEEAGEDFRLVVLGEAYGRAPAVFAAARERFAGRILHWGYAPTFADYAAWLWRADVLPVTSRQDFFGGSVVEAIYCGVTPVLPRRLAYPEHVPPERLYDDENGLDAMTRAALRERSAGAEARTQVGTYDWSVVAGELDRWVMNPYRAGDEASL